MPHPLTLHIDCDGVLINFTQGVLDSVKKLTGVTIPYDAIDNWHVFETIEKLHPEFPNIKKDLHECVAQQGWCYGLQPYPGARVAVEWLKQHVDVHIVTSPWHSSEFWHKERDMSLHRHFGITPKDITHTHRKYDIGGPVDIFVDDKPAHIYAVLKAGRVKDVYLWDSGPNRHEGQDLARLRSWRDLLRIVANVVRDGRNMPSDAQLASP